MTDLIFYGRLKRKNDAQSLLSVKFISIRKARHCLNLLTVLKRADRSFLQIVFNIVMQFLSIKL